ncbi:hypothetical protein ACFVHB_23165 [Kitasatospora sp. NPDC127111]|uniref:hypothetical protein n=1 Tax=Kitasatospora sp. NPDC127111 TaxID=3345363 RepID=UPI00364229F7
MAIPIDARKRWFLVAIGGIIAFAALVLVFWPSVRSDRVGIEGPINSSQLDSAKRAVREFFGPDMPLERVRLAGSTPNSGQAVRISVVTHAGDLTVSWPTGEVVSGRLGVPASANVATPLSDEDALEAGTEFARLHFPWALNGSEPKIHPVGGGGDNSRIVEWRSRKGGILLPMRLDVIVAGDRQVSSFAARHVDMPVLPGPVLSAESAYSLALVGHPGMKIGSSELISKVDDSGVGHIYWLMSLVAADVPNEPYAGATGVGDGRPANMVAIIDAVNGSVVDSSKLAEFSG